jgi:(hydroxyamino)benzene mutase
VNRSLFRHAFVLILLALLSGLFVPAMAVPRLGLSAHTIGVLSGTLLIAIGAIWQHFRLAGRLRCLLQWSWLYASYINWLGCLLGAILGAGAMTPVAAPGISGSALAEATVMVMLASVALASFIAVGLSLWGLRGRD